jgi:hypothetical protein
MINLEITLCELVDRQISVMEAGVRQVVYRGFTVSRRKCYIVFCFGFTVLEQVFREKGRLFGFLQVKFWKSLYEDLNITTNMNF